MSKPKKKPTGNPAKRTSPSPAVKAAPKPASQTGFWKRNWPGAVILLILPFALYGASLKYGYVLDDKIVLSENNFVKKGLAGIGDIFSTESFTGYLGEQKNLVAGSRYRPLSIATFAVEHHFWGLNPRNSHFLNILFYALTGLLLFRVLALFLRQDKDRKWHMALPILAAVLFILHPIHTEVVANIKGRDEILALLLSLGAFYFSYRYAVYRKIADLALAGPVFLLALLAKENALTFLAVIPAALYLFAKTPWRRILTAMAPLFAAFIVYLVIRVSVIGFLLDSGQEITGIMNNPFYGLSPGQRSAMITYTLGKYLQLLFFPHPLTHDYYPYQVPLMNWGDWRALLSLFLNLGLIYIAVRVFRKKPVLSWSIFFYFATLSIVSNIVISVGAPMNERFVYFSSAGFCLALAWLAVEYLPEKLKLGAPRNAWFSLGLLGLIAAGYAVKTVTRVPDWENEMTLNRAAIKVSVNSARANSYMAYSLYRAGVDETDQTRKKALFDEATPYVDRALEIYPEYTDALTCKGGLVAGYYQMDGNIDNLLDGFYQLLAARPVDFITQYLEYVNNRAPARKMTDFYHRAAYQLLAVEKRNFPLAIQYLNYGLKIDPNNILLLEDLTETYAMAGQQNDAVQTGQRGLAIQPESARIRKVLGN